MGVFWGALFALSEGHLVPCLLGTFRPVFRALSALSVGLLDMAETALSGVAQEYVLGQCQPPRFTQIRPALRNSARAALTVLRRLSPAHSPSVATLGQHSPLWSMNVPSAPATALAFGESFGHAAITGGGRWAYGPCFSPMPAPLARVGRGPGRTSFPFGPPIRHAHSLGRQPFLGRRRGLEVAPPARQLQLKEQRGYRVSQFLLHGQSPEKHASGYGRVSRRCRARHLPQTRRFCP